MARGRACFALALLVACIGLSIVLQAKPGFVGASGTRSERIQVARGAVIFSPGGDQRQKGDGSGQLPHGPISAYSFTLMDAAKKKQQAVPVTKDIMKIRKKFGDGEFRNTYYIENNRPGTTELRKAEILNELLEPESEVTKKFITFLAKKRRLKGLPAICDFFVGALYREESIEAVLVTSAEELSPEQIQTIKDKMKEKTGASEIKIVSKLDPSLLSGFKITWSFMDPDNLENPTKTEDVSLKYMLQQAALQKGIVVA